MTDQDLRDLLQERVADLTTTDLAASAWRDASRQRTRRRGGAIAALAAGVLVVAGVTAVLDSRHEQRGDGAPATTSPGPDQPDATADGAPVYWSPDPAAEKDLGSGPSGPLPAVIDLAAQAPPLSAAPVDRAIAVFGLDDGGRVDRLLLLVADGYRSLTLTEPVALLDLELAPDGTAIHLTTEDGVAMSYPLAEGEWRGDRHGDAVHQEPPPQVGDATAYGPVVPDPGGERLAQAYDYGSDVPPAPGAVDQPETIVVTPAVGPATILAINAPAGDLGGRWKRCCPVAGWIDDGTLVYESRSAEPRLVGWEVGTHHFTLVSRITGLGDGEGYVASFARLADGGGMAAEGPDPDAVSQGVPVWWSPDLGEELLLPWLDDSPLPREVDAPADAPDQSQRPLDRAVAALGVGDSAVRLLGPAGEQRLLATPGLVATTSTLSPDGRRLVFGDGHLLRVYTLATDTWGEIDAGDAETAYVAWADESTLWLPSEQYRGRGPLLDLAGARVGAADLGAPANGFDVRPAMDNPVGPWKENGAGLVAQSWGMGGPMLPVRDSGRYVAGPAYLAVTGRGETRALAFMTETDDVRWMDAPVVAGWLDDDTVLYESVTQNRDLLVAWDVGTHVFHRVLSIRPGGATSLARLVGR